VSLNGGFPIRHILVALVVIPALYLVFNIYQAGNSLIALTMLIVICLGAFIYLSDLGYMYRHQAAVFNQMLWEKAVKDMEKENPEAIAKLRKEGLI
jgi:hypothetical protein